MNNIIKSQLYKVFHNKIIWFSLFVAICLNMMAILDIEKVKITGSMVAINSGGFSFACVVFIGVASAMITGNDFLDKTINYEIMVGHRKADIYYGREIIASVFSVIGVVLIAVFGPALFTLINGWGNSITFSEFLCRNGCVLIVVLKLAALICMLSFILKNHYASMGLVFTIGFMEFIINMLNILSNTTKTLLSVPSIYKLTDFANTVSKHDYVVIIIVNIVELIVFTLLGYIYLTKTDME